MKKNFLTLIFLVFTVSVFSQNEVMSVPVFENGDIIVSSDLTIRGILSKSTKPNDLYIIGVYQEPEKESENVSNKVFINPIKTGGIVRVKYSNEGGAIKKGDLITTSSKPGVGMKATDKCLALGVALEDGMSESGLIKIRILIQFVN